MIRAQLAFIDSLIGEMRRANPGASLVVVSPSAAETPALPVSLASFIQIAYDLNDPGRNDGFIMMSASRFEHRANPSSAEIVDVVPTVLFAAGLPVARDLDGRVLAEAFDEQILREQPLTMISSYTAERVLAR
jgi:hypothetical protein